jgi:nicotinamidase-related amidase
MRGTIPWQSPDLGRPDTLQRLEIDLERTGLLVIDIQYVCASPDHGPPAAERAWQPEVVERWGQDLRERVIPNVQQLLGWFRARRLPVVHTRVGSYLPDGLDLHVRRREATLRHHGEGPLECAFGDPLHAILAEVAPLEGELVIDKNASGAFVGSGIDFSLQSLGLQTLVACGVATHACVHHTVRDAADRGYNVILVSDACKASPGNDAAHARTLQVFEQVFGAVKNTRQVLSELEAVAGVPAPAVAPPRRA